MHFDKLRNRETLFLSLFIFLLIKSNMLTEKNRTGYISKI